MPICSGEFRFPAGNQELRNSGTQELRNAGTQELRNERLDQAVASERDDVENPVGNDQGGSPFRRGTPKSEPGSAPFRRGTPKSDQKQKLVGFGGISVVVGRVEVGFGGSSTVQKGRRQNNLAAGDLLAPCWRPVGDPMMAHSRPAAASNREPGQCQWFWVPGRNPGTSALTKP